MPRRCWPILHGVITGYHGTRAGWLRRLKIWSSVRRLKVFSGARYKHRCQTYRTTEIISRSNGQQLERLSFPTRGWRGMEVFVAERAQNKSWRKPVSVLKSFAPKLCAYRTQTLRIHATSIYVKCLDSSPLMMMRYRSRRLWGLQ